MSWRAPLRHRGFRFLAGGQLASNLGDAFYAVALPWYVLATHGGVVLLGTVLAAYGIPRTVLVAVGGHASDRWRPWTVMMTADTIRAVSVAGLAVAAWSGPARPVVLIPIAVVIGAGEGLFLPGSFSIIPELLPGDDLQAGNALAQGGTQLATLVGPAIGGGVVALAGPASAFAVDAATFVVSAASLAGIRAVQRAPALLSASAPAPAADGPVTGDATAVPSVTLFQLIRSERVLQVILAITLAANLGLGGLSEVALPALAHGPFRAGAAGYGGLIAAFGAGALAGTLAAGQAGRLRRPAMTASAAFLAAGVLMGLVPYLGSPLAAGAALAGFGVLNGFGNVVTITAFQHWAPPQLMGRLMSLVLLASFGLFPVSVALSGLFVGRFGPAPFFPVAAAVLVAAVLAGLTQPRWRQFGARAGGPAPLPAEPPAAAAS